MNVIKDNNIEKHTILLPPKRNRIEELKLVAQALTEKIDEEYKKAESEIISIAKQTSLSSSRYNTDELLMR